MIVVLEVVFWVSVAAVVYVYAGYPLLLRALAGRRAVSGPVRQEFPPVTLIVSVFNEEGCIRVKLENCLALDYPADRLEVIVVSDASTDGTDAIVAGFAAHGIRLLRMPERGGKTVGLNAAVAQARGDVVVFSDANAMYRPDAIQALVAPLADAGVGAVIGESGYVEPDSDAGRSESLYWRYETAIKRLESLSGSVVGGDGAIYAVRRSLYLPMTADALSDFVNPLQVVRSGYRCVYEPAASSREETAAGFDKEFRRKVRIVNRAWRALMTMKDLMNPLRYGRFAWQLVSHKLLRWLVPGFLLMAFVANLGLVGQRTVYDAALIAQLLFYGFALAGALLRDREKLTTLLYVPYYFCLVNVASARGILEAYRGKTYTTWSTARADG
jgi:cellulose synthase/poly-beta-1,6-N-acetylglucosamine synthase-like glycosyltransferase